MSLLLCIRAKNNDKCFKTYYSPSLANLSNWIIHGTPQYSTDIHPDGFDDSFYLNSSTWIESPANALFNFYQKSFTITWWEYSAAGNAATEAASIDFAANTPLASNNYLLLSYVAAANKYNAHYARNSISGGWTLISNMSSGGAGPNNQWINLAFTSKFENNTHVFTSYRNGIKQATLTTTNNTFANVGSSGKMFIGTYSGHSSTIYGGPNKYLQNIKMYDEVLFDSNYNVEEFEHYGENALIFNNLKEGNAND